MTSIKNDGAGAEEAFLQIKLHIIFSYLCRISNKWQGFPLFFYIAGIYQGTYI